MKRPSKAARGATPAKSKQTAAAAPKGCCTITSDDGPDREIEGVTKAECDAIANAHPGSYSQWVPGACAE